jgi:hypothetical protein
MFVDVESVARSRCGYPAFESFRDCFDGSRAEWRRPIARTEAAVARMVGAVEFLPGILEEWLWASTGCGSRYVGLRYPPSFGALIAVRWALSSPSDQNLSRNSPSKPNFPIWPTMDRIHCIAGPSRHWS